MRETLETEEGETFTDTRPSDLRVVVGVDEGDEDIEHAVLAVGVGLILVHVGEGEEILLDLAGHLLFNLFGGGAGIDDSDDSLLDLYIGEFVLVQMRQSVDTDANGYDYRECENWKTPHCLLYQIGIVGHGFWVSV